ncbi:coiled-coil domain-containing protein-domain-containing protein [Cladorrhinum sp. PSN332]|nr:coiled-coil domain-containing protein-domain-containing protein [Cladorrhinum sp. PSN332]
MAPCLASSTSPPPPPPPGRQQHSSSTISGDLFNLTLIDDKPRPRPPRSSAHATRIRVQNRRREYLERHAEYFAGEEHELADPLLYDFLVRRFWTPAEREADGKRKGYARVLEGSLLRGEERLSRLKERSETETEVSSWSHRNGNNGDRMQVDQDDQDTDDKVQGLGLEIAIDGEEASHRHHHNAELVSPPPRSKTEGQDRWKEFLRDRFIKGMDDDFDYVGLVDGREEYDAVEEREREDEWFEGESPGWASDGDGEEGDRVIVERELKGETGVQDF